VQLLDRRAEAMRMRLGLLVALLALSGAAALAQSPPPITVLVYPEVTPDRAGTPAHPQGVRLDVRIAIGIPEGYEPPLLSEIDVWFPRGGLFEGGRYPTCSVATLDRKGPAGCPAASIMGYGGGVARADTAPSYPKITVVNGGQRVVDFYTVLNNPARVQEPVPGTVTRLSGRWSYRLQVVIPKNLQVVAGVPLVLQSLHIAAGRGDWLATTYCPPDHRWRWKALAVFDEGQQLSPAGAVACRR
jgi:hypothetical protein